MKCEWIWEKSPLFWSYISLKGLHTAHFEYGNGKHVYSSSQKKGDISVLLGPIQTKAKWPFHTRKNGNGTGWGTAMTSDWTCSRLFQSYLEWKRCLESLRKPKEALLYLSDHIWRHLIWLATLGWLIIDSRLGSQSSLNRRTRPKSKNSRVLLQKTLEDNGSIKQ